MSRLRRAGMAGLAALALASPTIAAEAPPAAAPPATPPATAPATPPVAPPAAEAAPAASALPVEALLDQALEHYYAKRYAPAAAGLYNLFRGLPETELKRDTIEFYLASSLAKLGYSEGAVEHWVDIIVGRRAPELVGRSLAQLDELVRAGLLDEARVIDEVLFGNLFGDLTGETADFVEYHQGLGELRRGFTALGVRRLEELARATTYWGWRARYALAVERLAEGNDEGAEKLLRPIVDDEAAPGRIRNDARAALARQLYGQKKFAEAFELYSKIDTPITKQDQLLVEKAWAKVAARDERRALGMEIGLGAPVYHLVFAPERWLIRTASLDRLCQFRAAHLAVLDFRGRFRVPLAHIRDRRAGDDPVLRQAALARVDLVPAAPWRDRLAREKAQLATVADKVLRDHLDALYEARLGQAEASVARGLERALDAVSDQLLAVDEQMTILDYEIGVGLFKGLAAGDRDRAAQADLPIPPGGPRAFFRFDGEYWSDEVQDYEVRAEDRCLR